MEGLNLDEKKALYQKAYAKNPRDVIALYDVYCGTDMPAKEYWAHLKIIAEEEE